MAVQSDAWSDLGLFQPRLKQRVHQLLSDPNYDNWSDERVVFLEDPISQAMFRNIRIDLTSQILEFTCFPWI